MSYKIGDRLRLVTLKDTTTSFGIFGQLTTPLSIGDEVTLTKQMNFISGAVGGILAISAVDSVDCYRFSDFELVMREGFFPVDSTVKEGDEVVLLSAFLANIDYNNSQWKYYRKYEDQTFTVINKYEDYEDFDVLIENDEATLSVDLDGLGKKAPVKDPVEESVKECLSHMAPTPFEELKEYDAVTLLSSEPDDFYMGDNYGNLQVGEIYVIDDIDYRDKTIGIEDEEGNATWVKPTALRLTSTIPSKTSQDPVEVVPLDIESIWAGDELVLTSYRLAMKGQEHLTSVPALEGTLFRVLYVNVPLGQIRVQGTNNEDAWKYTLNIEGFGAKPDEDPVEEPVEVEGGWGFPEKPHIATVITEDSVTINIDGRQEIINHDDENFGEIRQLVFDGKHQEAIDMINVVSAIESFGQGALQITGGVVLYNNQPLVGELVTRIIDMMKAGDESFEPLAKFLNLILENPSFKSRERLMSFAAHDTLDITDEGHIIAFKNVRDDYMDKHSGNFRNMIGDSPSMARSDVDDNHSNECSQGLHVCAASYLKGFWGTSGRTMRVTVDPRDMVAVPYGYANSKARVSKYIVVEDVTDDIKKYLDIT